MPFFNSNCVSSCHLTNERQSAAIRLGNAGPDNIKINMNFFQSSENINSVSRSMGFSLIILFVLFLG